MGIILNPFLGTNCKTAAVLTNLELKRTATSIRAAEVL